MVDFPSPRALSSRRKIYTSCLRHGNDVFKTPGPQTLHDNHRFQGKGVSLLDRCLISFKKQRHLNDTGSNAMAKPGGKIVLPISSLFCNILGNLLKVADSNPWLYRGDDRFFHFQGNLEQVLLL